MAEQKQNPYESPETPAASAPAVDWELRPAQRFWFLFGVSVGAMFLSGVAPYIGIPLAFLIAPAIMRAWRLSHTETGPEPRRHFAVLVISSFLYAIPCAFASGIAFCCICFPGGYVGATFFFAKSDSYGLMAFAAMLLIFVSIFLALWAGNFVLRRNKHFIRGDQSPDSGTEIDGLDDT